LQAKINSLTEENAELRRKDESEKFERRQREAEQQTAFREVEELKRTCERLAESEGRLRNWRHCSARRQIYPRRKSQRQSLFPLDSHSVVPRHDF